MNTRLTATLKLHTTPQQFAQLRATQLAYRDALNYVSRYSFEHGKISNKVALQEGTYYEIRTRFKLPAQMACSVPRQVGATYKGLWTKVKQNAQARMDGRTKKRYKGLDQPPKYVSPTLEYHLGHDYSFKQEQRVSVLTLQGRISVAYTGYNTHVALIQQGAELGAAKLWYDQPKKQCYLLVSLAIETADPTPEQHTQVVGVDVGVRYLAVTSTTQEDCTFYAGKSLVPKANHYARLRKRLQQKGTRSATRRLKVISGRERRGTARRYSCGANAKHSKWSFAELHNKIAYKATLHESMAVKVDAHYSSQACLKCGHTCEANRPKKGLLFICQHCHYTLHADLVGARNMTLRTLLHRQDWCRTGVLSIRASCVVRRSQSRMPSSVF
jgi:putative transposase